MLENLPNQKKKIFIYANVTSFVGVAVVIIKDIFLKKKEEYLLVVEICKIVKEEKSILSII